MIEPNLDEEQNANLLARSCATCCGGLEVEKVGAVPIAALNDAFRRSFSGGRVVLSAGIAGLPSVARAALIAAVRGFDRFDADDDPHGEHDSGVVTVAGYRCCWKIDCYDISLSFASPDSTDPAVTVRMLTVMLAEEY